MTLDGFSDDVVMVAEAAGIALAELHPEQHNGAYGGAVARTGGGVVRLRAARVTPKYPGVFVATWKRSSDGSTVPYADVDQERMLIVARDGDQLGAFDVPTRVLVEHGVVSVDGRGGKRGFRLYPPWSRAPNRSAAATQRWQLACFRTLPSA